MKKAAALFVLFGLAAAVLAGCSGGAPAEEAVSLKANGFTTSYHQYMWTLAGSSETEYLTEATYSYYDGNAFFSVVRIGAEAAKEQGLTVPEAMETLLKTYVANYNGSNEKITAGDNEQEYVRELAFEYDDADMNEKYTYTAKMMMNKASGEVMIVLAGYPNSGDKQLKTEVALISDSAVMQEMVAA